MLRPPGRNRFAFGAIELVCVFAVSVVIVNLIVDVIELRTSTVDYVNACAALGEGLAI